MSIRAQTLHISTKSKFLDFKVFQAPLGPMGLIGTHGTYGAHGAMGPTVARGPTRSPERVRSSMGPKRVPNGSCPRPSCLPAPWSSCLPIPWSSCLPIPRSKGPGIHLGGDGDPGTHLGRRVGEAEGRHYGGPRPTKWRSGGEAPRNLGSTGHI